ncbi:hypothetical protein M404DRAFT_769206 [Pisolithus tinctorius Marx 270]|uniref:Uncharacterized protein n=1 Tax=Pisolithus tinctorius Marx 270 TaxID=870435 RepID=A0A0C3NYF9_PISTI|nr:hypothetical protein M404DRAFT_769206 [Pisolithus tinctorius Marx 270]
MGAKRIELVTHSNVVAVTFVGESQVVGGHEEGEIRRWNITDGQQQGPTIRAEQGYVCSIVVSQDGRWMVTGDSGQKAIVWNTATLQKVREFSEHGNSVLGVDISSDCTKIASVDFNNVQIFGTASSKRLLPPLTHPHVVGVKFSPDGSRFATASRDHGFRVYNTHNGDILFDSGQKGSTGSWSRSPLAWSFDGQQLFVACTSKIACFDLSESSYSEWSIHANSSSQLVAIASNGRFIACSAGSSVTLWDCMSHKQISSIVLHAAEILCLTLSLCGAYLACGLDGGKITIHNLRDVLPPKCFNGGLATPCYLASTRTSE